MSGDTKKADAARLRLLRALQDSSVPGAEEMATELQGVIDHHKKPGPYSWWRHFSTEPLPDTGHNGQGDRDK